MKRKKSAARTSNHEDSEIQTRDNYIIQLQMWGFHTDLNRFTTNKYQKDWVLSARKINIRGIKCENMIPMNYQPGFGSGSFFGVSFFFLFTTISLLGKCWQCQCHRCFFVSSQDRDKRLSFPECIGRSGDAWTERDVFPAGQLQLNKFIMATECYLEYSQTCNILPTWLNLAALSARDGLVQLVWNMLLCVAEHTNLSIGLISISVRCFSPFTGG